MNTGPTKTANGAQAMGTHKRISTKKKKKKLRAEVKSGIFESFNFLSNKNDPLLFQQYRANSL